MIQHTAILTMADRMIYRTVPYSMTLNDPYPQFPGHAHRRSQYEARGGNCLLLFLFWGSLNKCVAFVIGERERFCPWTSSIHAAEVAWLYICFS